MYWIIVNFLAVVLVLAGAACNCRAADVISVQKKMDNAIRIEKTAQEKADKWAQEKERILAEIQDLKHREQWLDFQCKKYNKYIEEEKEIIGRLSRKKEEIEKIKTNLEPYLEEIYQRLEEFVKNDLRFLPEERKKRLAFLRSSLDDYRVELSEKLRRILEALQVEANYGRSIDKTEGIIDLDGKKTEVNFIRIGRLALFFLSEDQKKPGYLDRKTGQWKMLDRKYAKELVKAVEMAERKRAIDLVDLPIGTWKKDLPGNGEKQN